MKKLATILGILAFVSMPVYAAEETAQEEIILEANKAVIAIQKQPLNEKSNQKADVKNNWFCVVIQVNGKVLDKTDN